MRAPLHVHHRKQFAVSDIPRMTRARDLVTVCANCHTMIHSDPKRALPEKDRPHVPVPPGKGRAGRLGN